MPPVHLSCPHCTGILQVEPHLAGRQVTCPTCLNPITIPTFGPELTGAALGPPGMGPPGMGPPGMGPPAPPSFAPPAPPPPGPGPGSPGYGSSQDPLPLACPHCSGLFQVLPSMAGQAVACPHCQVAVTVPSWGPPAPPAPAPAPLPSPAPPPSPSPQFGPPLSPVAPPGPPPAVPGPPAPLPVSSGPTRPIPVTPRPVSGPVTPIEERSKTIGRGDEKVELRKLTPEERAQRRRTRNLIMGVMFVGILLAVFIILLAME